MKNQARRIQEMGHSSESEFEPDNRTYTYSRWSRADNQRYVGFLRQFLCKKGEPTQRKPYKFFTKMASAIRTNKTALQCRCHHQKMMLAHGTIQTIIDYWDSSQQPNRLGPSCPSSSHSAPGDSSSQTTPSGSSENDEHLERGLEKYEQYGPRDEDLFDVLFE